LKVHAGTYIKKSAEDLEVASFGDEMGIGPRENEQRPTVVDWGKHKRQNGDVFKVGDGMAKGNEWGKGKKARDVGGGVLVTQLDS